MTLLLILHMIGSNGEQSKYNMALFARMDDCRLAGRVISDNMTKENKIGVSVMYTCEPV